MNMLVKMLFIIKMQKFVQSLLNSVKEIVFNHLELYERVLFLIEKIMLNMFGIKLLKTLLFSDPTITCSTNATTHLKE
jgi:hypothetical protein